MAGHKDLNGSDLHEPKGKFPDFLDLDDDAAEAYKIYEDGGDDNYVVIDTTDGAEKITLGNTDTDPAVSVLGTGLFTTGGGHRFNVTEIAAGSRDMDAASFVVLADTSAGPITYNLENPATVANQVFFVIDKTGSFAGNNLTLVRDGAETIDGAAANKIISTTNARLWLFCDGSDYYTLLDDAVSIPADIVADTLKIDGTTLVANLAGYEDRVGIGTATPDRQLHLHNTSGTSTYLQVTNATTGEGSDGKGFQFGIGNDGTANIVQRENLDIAIHTNNAERLRVLASGNLGIGTDAPATKLHVDGTVTVEDAVRIGSVAVATELLTVDGDIHVAGQVKGLDAPTDSNDAATKAYVDGAASDGWDGTSGTAPVLGGNLDCNGKDLEDANSLVVDTTTLVANLAGYEDRVGIGTATPAEKLHLKTDTGDATVKIETTTAGDPTIIFETQSNRDGVIKFQESGVNSGSLKYAHNGDVFKFIAGSVTAVRAQIGESVSYFTSDLGIGTDAPATKLHVDGAVTVNGLISGVTDPVASSDAATKNYVDASVADAGDLDISDGSSAIAITLASETLTIGGTSNEIETTAAGNSITVGLPSDVTIGNELTVTGATLCGSRVDIDDSGTGDRIGLLGAWGDVGGGTLPNAKDFVIKAETGLGVALSPNNGAPVAYAASGGNFGIGTTAPTEKLEVNGTIKVSGATTHGNRVEIREGATAHTSAQLAAWNDLGGGSVPPDGRDFVIKAGADLGISLAPGNGGSKVYVTKLGNVGIGTTAPAEKLEVTGAIKVGGKITNVTDPAAASDAATKNYVDASVAAADLDISAGDDTTIAITLASEVLTITGTANEIETTAAGNSITVGLPAAVTIGSELTVEDSLSVNTDTLVVNAAGYADRIGVNTTAPGKALEVNSADGNNLRLTYNDSNGSAANFADLQVSSAGYFALRTSAAQSSPITKTTVTALSSASNKTYGVDEVFGGYIIRDPAGDDRSDVTPAAEDIIAAIPNCAAGDSFRFLIKNAADAAEETITVTGGTGITITGTATIGQNNTKEFLCVITDPDGAATIYSLGTFTH